MKFILIIFLFSIYAFCQETQVNTTTSYDDCKDLSIRIGLSPLSSIDKEFDVDINGQSALVYIHDGLISTDNSFLYHSTGDLKGFCTFAVNNAKFPNKPLIKVHFSNVKITFNNMLNQIQLKTEQQTYPLLCYNATKPVINTKGGGFPRVSVDASVGYLAERLGSVATLRCNERIDVTGSVSPKQNADSVKKVPDNNKKPGKTKTTNSTQKAS